LTDYFITMTQHAVDQVTKWPVCEQQQLQKKLTELAKSPVCLSRPATLYEKPGYQVFEFALSETEACKVFFQYGQDEQTLHIAVVARGPAHSH